MFVSKVDLWIILNMVEASCISGFIRHNYMELYSLSTGN